METISKSPKKLWRPPSFEDFETRLTKRIKLEKVNGSEEEINDCVNVGQLKPNTVEELGTASKKVQEVEAWLDGAMLKRGSVLLMTGPAGCGKTATIKLVAAQRSVTVREWVTPLDKQQATDTLIEDPTDRVMYRDSGQVDKFSDFMFRVGRYGALFEEAAPRTVLLVEDFPNVFVWDPKKFHAFLASYRTRGKAPIVFIATDDDKLDLQATLFPPRVRQDFAVDVIKFSPMTKAAVVKLLTRAAALQDTVEVSRGTLDGIVKSCNGDVRSALSGLQVLLAGLKPTKRRTERKKSKKEREALKPLAAVTAKDTHIEFYRSVGRVLFPKRTATGPRRFLYDVLEIAESYSNSVRMLLHENYLNTFGKMKDLVRCMEGWSEWDLLHGTPELRDCEALTTVIGLMEANTEPRKGVFRPLQKSAWSSGSPAVPSSPLQALGLSTRVLHLDVIPYMKLLPEYCPQLAEGCSDRLLPFTPPSLPLARLNITQTRGHTDSSDDECTIEEDED